MTYFDSFGVEYIPKEIEKFINNKNIITNINRIQAYDSIMCDISVLSLLISCLRVKFSQILKIYLHQTTLKIMRK